VDIVPNIINTALIFNTQSETFYISLHGIVPFCRYFRAFNANQQYMAKIIVFQEFFLDAG
jgi:hypothetical protein